MYHRLYDYLEQFKALQIPYNSASMRKNVRPPMTFFVSLGLSASQLMTLNLAVEYFVKFGLLTELTTDRKSVV